MTILNRENDGLHTVLLTLAGIIADGENNPITCEDLLNLCAPYDGISKERAGHTLRKWTALGLFAVDDNRVRLGHIKKGETVDGFCDRLPLICRRLSLHENNGSPLWGSSGEEGAGLTADLCRGLAWCFAQDIYSLPNSWDDINEIIAKQTSTGIVQNDTRWNGLKAWAPFLGFATGNSRLFWDPTLAIRSELGEIFQGKTEISADSFLNRLADLVPVLDGGIYYQQITQVLNDKTWPKPDTNCLSTALSFALRNLGMQGIIRFESRADSGVEKILVRQGGRIWDKFTHINQLKAAV